MPSFLKSNRCNRPSAARLLESLEPRAYFSVDLTGSVSVIPTAQVKPGGHIIFVVEISNVGTSTAIGQLQTVLGFSGGADGASATPLATAKKHLHLKSGATTTFHVTEKIPVGYTPGTYFAVADIDPSDTFADTNLANNIVVSAASVTIPSLYRDILGTFVGTAVIKKGLDKGLVFNQSITNISENFTTGIVSFNGTNTFPGGTVVEFAGTTTLKPNGTYTVIGQDTPPDSSGTFRDTARLVGNTGVGRFVTAINSGTFSGTLVMG